MRRNLTRPLLQVSVLSIFCASLAFAQTAEITGRVSDPSGGVIPQASVKVTNVDNGTSRTSASNDQGYFTVSALIPGSYEVRVEKDGFKPIARTGIRLNVDDKTRIDFALQVGNVHETVEVSANAVQLESESSTLGHLVQNRQISELPLLGRDPYALAMLVPGARTSAGLNNLPVDIITTSSASLNGARGNQNEFLLDGAPNTSPASNQPVIYPSADSVQEFKVETNSFSAEYGRAAGGVFNAVTKPGTNDLHLSLYDFLRNDKLNANDFFANRAGRTRPPFRFNQYGVAGGGPIIIPHVYNGKNRTFFFASWEAVRFAQGNTFTGSVPDPRQLTGDFSQLRNAAGAPVVVYDPLSIAPNPAGGFLRTPFSGNVIPTDRIDPVARNLGKYWPAPNAQGTSTGVNNFVQTDANRVYKDTFSIRIDHHTSDKNQFFTRFSYDDSPWIRARAYGNDNIASPSAGPQDFGRRNAVVEDTYIFSPSLLGTFRYSYARLGNFRQSWSNGFDITQLGFPAGLGQQFGPPASFPVILVTGYGVSSLVPNTLIGGALGAGDLIRLGTDSHAWQGTLSKTLSKHTLKTGFEYRLIRGNMLQHGDQGTQFSFSPAWTQGPNPTTSSATAGNALASFLLGLGSGSVTPAPALALQSTYYGMFLQDDFKVTPKLTLNLGLRYEYESPRTDRYNQFANFDYSAKPPLNVPGMNLQGALMYPGVNGVSRFQSNPDRNNFAPRIGFAWQVMSKTVLRGGGGIFYAPFTGLGSSSGAFGESGFEVSTSMVTSLDGVTPLNYLRNPYPQGMNKPSGSSLGTATLLGQGISFFDRTNRVPYVEQWNLNVQRILPGSIVMEVGYAGSHGLKQPTNLQLNQLPDSALALKDQLRSQTANPFYGQIPIGALAQRTVSQAQLLRPYPQFDGVTSVNANWDSSTYHALIVKVEKRYTSGLTLMGSYTYSKMMDYSYGTFSGESLGGGGFQNWNNRRADWSTSLLDQTHRFIVNAVYELPFGKGLQGLAQKLTSGWQVSGIYAAFSGGPLGVSSAVNNTFSLGGGQRPNWSGVSAAVSNPTPNHWIDSSVFSNPPAYTFGNAGRTFSGLRSDGTSNLDFSLNKNTRFRERYTLQFRAECFNLANHVQFAPPNATFGNAQFGVVSGQANQPRVVQFALKLMM